MPENKSPFVSIAVCTYNGEKHLIEQLDTLVNQSYANKEIIIVDDCSSDGTQNILKQYAGRFPFIDVHYNEVNLGYAKNFEKAISLCKGDFIALSDQDDIWDHQKIEMQVSTIGSYALCYHDSELIEESGISLNKCISGKFNLYEGKYPQPFMFFNCISGHTIMFKKELVKDIIPFHAKYFHDWWISMIATERGGIKLLPQPLVKYRQHSASTTDILGIRTKENIDYTFFNQENIEFIRLLSGKSIYNKKYFLDFLSCFSSDYSVIKKTKLFYLLLSNYKLIFHMMKKSDFSKLNFIRKISFQRKHSNKN
jgi:glycosyltransferase involved in cell wall biosynthesis